MNTRGAKNKGRKLQNHVRDLLRGLFPELEEDDIKSQTMGMTGEDIVLSPAARKMIPYTFECKNVEKLSIWKAIEQCEANALKIDAKSKQYVTHAVVFKKNRKEPHVAIRLPEFLYLIKEAYNAKKD